MPGKTKKPIKVKGNYLRLSIGAVVVIILGLLFYFFNEAFLYYLFFVLRLFLII